MDLGISGRVALVGGGTRGIGRAVAISCARHGATVLLLGRPGRALEDVHAQITTDCGAERAAINRRVGAWRFRYAREEDRRVHAAITVAAAFIREARAHFPAGTAPVNALGIAALALRVYSVFLPPGPTGDAAAIARSVVAAREAFDLQRGCA